MRCGGLRRSENDQAHQTSRCLTHPLSRRTVTQEGLIDDMEGEDEEDEESYTSEVSESGGEEGGSLQRAAHWRVLLDL